MKSWVNLYLRRLALSPLAGSALVALAVVNFGVAVCLVQAIVAGTELNVGIPQGKPTAATQRERSALAPKPLRAYLATLSRPVFFKTRQLYIPPPPPAPEKVEPAPVALAHPELTLSGIIIAAGAKRAYLVPKENPGGGSWIGEGEEIQGWQVNAISDSSVALQRSDRIIYLLMYPGDQTKPGSAR